MQLFSIAVFSSILISIVLGNGITNPYDAFLSNRDVKIEERQQRPIPTVYEAFEDGPVTPPPYHRRLMQGKMILNDPVPTRKLGLSFHGHFMTEKIQIPNKHYVMSFDDGSHERKYDVYLNDDIEDIAIAPPVSIRNHGYNRGYTTEVESGSSRYMKKLRYLNRKHNLMNSNKDVYQLSVPDTPNYVSLRSLYY